MILRHLLLAAALACTFAGGAAAQPSQPLTIVVPAPAGGGLDALARLLALHMTRVTGETVVVENRSGANTIVAMEHVARSAPNGRTVLITGVSLAINDLLFKLSFSPLQDLSPVILLSDEYTVMVVPAESEIRTAADLERVARSRPGGLNCGAPPGHMLLACHQLTEVLPSLTVPYPGIAPAVNATLGGHVDVLFVSPESVVRPYVDAGKLRIIAVADRLRSKPSLKNAAGFRQLWPGFLTTSYSSVWVASGTPPDIVAKLNRDFNQVLSEPEVRERMNAGNQAIVGGAPDTLRGAAMKAREEFSRVINRLKLAAPQ